MKVIPTFVIKAPIEGVRYSNEEVGLALEYEVENDDWESVKESLTKQMKSIVKDYFDKLQAEINDGQSEVLSELQIKLAKEYEGKLKKASEEIYKLRDLLKENGIQY
jgi:hypothetical protein